MAAQRKATAKRKTTPQRKTPAKRKTAAQRKAAGAGRRSASRSSPPPREAPARHETVPMDLYAYAEQHQSDLPEAAMLSALRAEHRHIASILALLSDHLNAIERSELVNTHVLYEIMDYMVTWTDRYHHPREDLIYGYAADIDRGLAEDCHRLEHDHDRMAKKSRELLHCIESWRAGEVGGEELIRLGREYVQGSYAHMSIEEQEVFPAIDAVLTRDDWRQLAADEQLKPVRDPVFGRRVQREFRNMARKLRRSLRRGVERRAVAEWVGIESLLEAYEVVSMALQSSRSVTRDQLLTGLRETGYIALDQPFRAPFLATANNARLTLQWLEEMQRIYRDAAVDILRVNRERQDRLRLLRRAARP